MPPRSAKQAQEGVHGPRWGRWTATVRDRATGKLTSLGSFLTVAEAVAAIEAFHAANKPPLRRQRWRHAQGEWRVVPTA